MLTHKDLNTLTQEINEAIENEHKVVQKEQADLAKQQETTIAGRATAAFTTTRSKNRAKTKDSVKLLAIQLMCDAAVAAKSTDELNEALKENTIVKNIENAVAKAPDKTVTANDIIDNQFRKIRKNIFELAKKRILLQQINKKKMEIATPILNLFKKLKERYESKLEIIQNELNANPKADLVTLNNLEEQAKELRLEYHKLLTGYTKNQSAVLNALSKEIVQIKGSIRQLMDLSNESNSLNNDIQKTVTAIQDELMPQIMKQIKKQANDEKGGLTTTKFGAIMATIQKAKVRARAEEERAEAERVAAEKAAVEKSALERAEAERVAREEAEKVAAAKERAELEKQAPVRRQKKKSSHIEVKAPQSPGVSRNGEQSNLSTVNNAAQLEIPVIKKPSANKGEKIAPSNKPEEKKQSFYERIKQNKGKIFGAIVGAICGIPFGGPIGSLILGFAGWKVGSYLDPKKETKPLISEEDIFKAPLVNFDEQVEQVEPESRDDMLCTHAKLSDTFGKPEPVSAKQQAVGFGINIDKMDEELDEIEYSLSLAGIDVDQKPASPSVVKYNR